MNQAACARERPVCLWQSIMHIRSDSFPYLHLLQSHVVKSAATGHVLVMDVMLSPKGHHNCSVKCRAEAATGWGNHTGG